VDIFCVPDSKSSDRIDIIGLHEIYEYRATNHLPDDNRGRMSACPDAKKCERIRVVVVESHQQVLPHVHGRLRQQRRRAHQQRPFARRHVEGWELVHFDSHADLACPVNLPAKRCWRPYPDEPNDSLDHDDDSSSIGMSLYEHLESTPSGIAEWIVPLVLGAGCTNVTWIRPPPSSPSCSGDLHQAHSARNASFPPGQHSFSVGAWMPVNKTEAAAPPPTPSSFLDLPIEARIRVDSQSPYYTDDEEGEEDLDDIVRRDFTDDAGGTADVGIKLPGCFAPAHELLFAQPVRLAVSYGDCEDDGLSEDRHAANSMPQGSPESHATSSPSPQPGIGDCGNDDVVDEKDWILDVCLDYFWCDNPFWHDLCQMNAGFAAALSWLVCQSDLYDGGLGCLSTSSSTPCQHEVHPTGPRSVDATPGPFYERRRRVLRFRQVLGLYLRAAAAAAAAGAPTAGPCVPAEQEASSAALSRLQRSLMAFYMESLALKAREAMQEVEATLAAIPDADDRTALVREGVQAIPYLTLPRDEGDPQQVVEARLVRFREFLNRSSSIALSALQPTNRRRLAPRPSLITVARSAQDGFLPIHLVDDIQGKVLDVLHDQYCACKSRRFGKVGGHEVSEPNMQRYAETEQRIRGSYRQESSDAIEDSCTECPMEIVIDYDHSDGNA
jgi:UPF0489 domain